MYILSKEILEKYNIDEENLIFLNSGKFYIKVQEHQCLEEFQKEVDRFFLENFFTNSGIYLFIVNLEEDFSKTLEMINQEKELKSFQKFSLWDKKPYLDDMIDFKLEGFDKYLESL